MNCFRPAAILAAALWAAPAGAQTAIKFATLAPEGTNAMRTMQAIDAELREKTGGKVSFKFYAGGRQGDEKDMVRKIRLGQLHAGGFTGVGLGEVAPEARILDAPWLFKDYAEVDHLHKTFASEFAKAFEAKGFVLLGWTDVGFVHVFSKAPVRSAADARKLKIWVWEGDPIAEAAFKAIGVHPIPLSIENVNTSLLTGLIDAVYSAPLYAIALQWHEKTQYVYDLPLAHASGAVLLSKKTFDGLPADARAALLEVSRRRLAELNEATRAENKKAVAELKKQGLKFTDPASPAEVQAYEEAGRKARRDLVGRLYSAQWLERVEKALAEYRARKPSKS